MDAVRAPVSGQNRRGPALCDESDQTQNLDRLDQLEHQRLVPRVLLVDAISGANAYSVELVRALHKTCRLTVFTVEDTPLTPGDCGRLLNAFPAFGRKSSRLRKALTTLVALYQLTKTVLDHRDGIVHIQFFRIMLPEIFIYWLCASRHRVVFTVHNVLPHEPKWWHRSLYGAWYGWVGSIHVLANYSRRILLEQFRVPDEKICHIPHGNYASMLTQHSVGGQAAARARLGLDDGTLLVLLFGAIRRYKGFDRAVLAAQRLSGEALPVRFVILGGGPSEVVAELRELATMPGAEAVEIVHRFVPDSELSLWLEAADVTAFPYRHIYQSGAVILALTYGKAIVASDLPGFREYIEHEQTGLLCDTEDVEQFAKQLDRLLKDSRLREDLGQRASSVAAEKLSWGALATQFAALYCARIHMIPRKV